MMRLLPTRAIRAGRADNETALAAHSLGDDDIRDADRGRGRRMATITAPNRFYSRYGNPTVRGSRPRSPTWSTQKMHGRSHPAGGLSAVILDSSPR